MRNMTYRTLKELEPANTVIVEDYLTRKHLFDDCEVIGWTLLEDVHGALKLYHLYRRGEDTSTQQLINEHGVYIDEPITENIKIELRNMFAEHTFNTSNDQSFN